MVSKMEIIFMGTQLWLIRFYWKGVDVGMIFAVISALI